MRLPDFRIEILIRRIDKKVIITNCLSAVHSPTLTKEKPNQILSGGGRTKQQANKNTWAHIQTHTCTPTALTLNPWLNPFSQTDIKRSKKKKKKKKKLLCLRLSPARRCYFGSVWRITGSRNFLARFTAERGESGGFGSGLGAALLF